jgi:hypothetical protein
MQKFSGHNGKRQSYKAGELDLFAIYCPENRQIYLMGFCEVLTQGRLRCLETKNHQNEKIRWGKDYLFETQIGAIREKWS